MIKKICFNSLLIVFAYLCISCGAPANQNAANAPANGNAAPSSGKSFKLAFVTNNASDYWTIARKGVESMT